MVSENPRVALVGPGAIGTTIAAMLHEVGHTPTLCGRTAYPKLVFRNDEGQIVVPGPVLTNPSDITEPFDLVFVAVKATQLKDAAAWLAVLCHENTVVCALQNGVEQKERLAPFVLGATVVPTVLKFSVQHESDGAILQRIKPRILLPDEPASSLVFSVLHGAFGTIEISTDYLSETWYKLLQNSVGALMTLTGRRAGMFRRPDIATLGLAYLQEALAVAHAAGAALSDDVPYELVTFFQNSPVDLGTSILADRLAGKPLEWDILNGAVQRFGRKHGIATPLSDVIVPLFAAASEGPG